MDELENIDPRDPTLSDVIKAQIQKRCETDPWYYFRRVVGGMPRDEKALVLCAQEAYNTNGYRGMFKYLASEEIYPMNMVLLALADLTAEHYNELNMIHTPTTTFTGSMVLQAKRAPECKLMVEVVLDAQAYLRHANAPLLESEFPDRDFLEEELQRIAIKLTPFKRNVHKVIAEIIHKLKTLGLTYLGHHAQRMFYLIERDGERCLVVMSLIFDEVLFEDDDL